MAYTFESRPRRLKRDALRDFEIWADGLGIEFATCVVRVRPHGHGWVVSARLGWVIKKEAN